jgi:hypothetical protein
MEYEFLSRRKRHYLLASGAFVRLSFDTVVYLPPLYALFEYLPDLTEQSNALHPTSIRIIRNAT